MKHIIIGGGLLFGVFMPAVALAVHSSNIVGSNPEHWAWNDVVGWIDFYPTGSATHGENANINVTNTNLQGYASSSVGFIAFDCATVPSGNCSGPAGNWKVTNDTLGTLSGWAWNDAIGWMSFSCENQGTCATSNYRVWVSTTTPSGTPCGILVPPGSDPECGKFHGWAWNDVVGWISFNCVNTSTCGTPPPPVDYWVKTTWYPAVVLNPATLDSSVFDMCPAGSNCGAQVNTIRWKGVGISGSSNGGVGFQIATSDCVNGASNPPACSTGNWNFIGPDGTGISWYTPFFDTVTGISNVAAIVPGPHQHRRYFRYRVKLEPNFPQAPIIHDIIINWSP